MIDTQEVIETVGPLMALRHTVEAHTALRPTAIMLPLSLLRGVEEVYGLPVVRGDRTALIYEPRGI